MPVTERSQQIAVLHACLRKAATEFIKLEISYADKDGVATQRIIWPLAILGWGDRWTVLGWCELRQDYRNFRLDRIAQARLLEAHFETGPELSYDHYCRTRLEG